MILRAAGGRGFFARGFGGPRSHPPSTPASTNQRASSLSDSGNSQSAAPGQSLVQTSLSPGTGSPAVPVRGRGEWRGAANGGGAPSAGPALRRDVQSPLVARAPPPPRSA